MNMTPSRRLFLVFWMVGAAWLGVTTAQEIPVQEGPVQEGPVQEGPVQEGPVQEGPVQEVPARDVAAHLSAGEFSVAIKRVDSLPEPRRDAVLAQVAAAQSSAGETVAAGTTLQGVRSQSSMPDGVASIAPAAGNGQGGGSFADFQSLIDLIQTTVVPDTWEALGGPSTMAPYPQGVYVDASGTIRDCQSLAAGDAVEDLKSLLSPTDQIDQPDQPLAWRQPSSLRCVSVRRLMEQASRWQLNGLEPSEAMLHLAGISKVQYLMFEENDILIAGPVGGIEQVQGWYRDRQSGLTPMRLDFLRTCLASSLANQPFGCTIDPTKEGLQRAATVGVAVQSNQIPIGKAAEEMVAALGMQRVEVFGTAGDTPLGYVMVEADRHMKQLALGIHPMPRGAVNYLDVIDASIDQGPPNELLLRLWFTSSPRSVRADSERKVFELAGTPIQLSGQNERAMAGGQRGNVIQDFRTDRFVAEFNQDWHAIRSEYPIYGALESIYQTASLAELIRRFGDEATHRQLAARLVETESQSDYLLPTPLQVESIATLHTVRHGRKRHHVLLVSGGVSVDSRLSLVSQVADYPSLSSMTGLAKTRPLVIQRWWWDAN